LSDEGVGLRHRPPAASIDPDTSKGWIRRILPILRSHRLIFGAALLAALVSIGPRVLIPRVVGSAIDNAIVPVEGARDPLSGYVGLLIGLAVVAMATGFVARYYLFRTAYAIEYDLRVLLYRHLARQSFSFYDRVQSGQLISRANSDVRAVQMFLAFAPFVFIQFGMLFAALWFMLRIDLGLTLIAVAVLPFVYWVGLRLRRYVFPVSWVIQSRMADMATIIDENVNGVRVVKSFAAEEAQIGALARTAQRVRWATLRMLTYRARFVPLMENLPRIGEALILLYGGFLVIDGRIGPGDILVFLSYLVMLQTPFRMLGFIMMLQQRAAASAQRIYEVLDAEPEIQDRPGAVDLVDGRGEVEFRDVHFAYPGGPPVLAGFDLHLARGEAVAVVGRTGSGKTTLAELLPRFYDVDAGQVLVDGHDVRDLTLASLRRSIGICFDEPFLFSASIHDNIAYGRVDASVDDVRRAAEVADADEFISRLGEGYETEVGERGYTLSGGQRQRVAIARTVVEDPRILILDDATSAIDVHVEMRIHEQLRRVLAGRTTLIIAHRLSTISLADRVVLLEGGRVVAEGTHAELLAREPRYVEVLAHLAEEDAAKAEAVEEEARAHHIVDGRGGRPDRAAPDGARWGMS
jgi:ATP-binding cassette subfamily B protein